MVFSAYPGTARCPADEVSRAKVYVYTEDRDGYTEFIQTMQLEAYVVSEILFLHKKVACN